jgi:hypothetical protein
VEAVNRKPFQGITNIIRFNWHFYIIAVISITVAILLKRYLSSQLSLTADVLVFLVITGTLISLAVSYYIYDHSGIYSLSYLNPLNITGAKKLVNINAGFDETSSTLREKYPASELVVFDFYDPAKHTEVSIERARKSYPSFPGTIKIETHNVPLKPGSADYIFLIFAAHEIRNHEERTEFFKQLCNALADSGRITITEHQRDIYNFFAFNFGFFHFFPEIEWISTFKNAGLVIESTAKVTPFVKNYTLKKAG